MRFIKKNYIGLLIMFFLIIVFIWGLQSTKKDFNNMYDAGEYT